MTKKAKIQKVLKALGLIPNELLEPKQGSEDFTVTYYINTPGYDALPSEFEKTDQLCVRGDSYLGSATSTKIRREVKIRLNF
jgi:hypothetical protein